MLKFILLTVFATALAEDNYKGKLYSMHAPEFMKGSLNLTTGELKQFSGHAMNIIHAKCPAVDSQKIFQVQKYIGKLIAKSEPVVGNSEAFKTLLNTMTECTKLTKPAEPEQEPEQERPSIFTSFFHPMRHIKTLWFRRPEPVPILPTIDEEEELNTNPTGIDSGLIEPTAEDEPTTSPLDLSAPRIVKTTILIHPQDMQDGIRSSGGFFNWIHNMFSKVTRMIGGFFPFSQIRKKRDLSEFNSFDDILDKDGKAHFAKPSDSDFGSFDDILDKDGKAHFTKPATYTVWTPKKDDPKGKKAFGALVDEMCRLYCDRCFGHLEIMNFKLAARELLQKLFNEESGLDLAASKFLDEDFLKSIHNCE